MLNKGDAMDPVILYGEASARAAIVIDAVRPDQASLATPCAEWSVQDLIDHLVGSTEYLRAALEGRAPEPRSGAGGSDYRAGRTVVLAGLATPGAMERTCLSPLGFEWTVAQATAGTFMDTLVHTWDLASATGHDTRLELLLVDACIAMFLPDMPERGRAAGLVGPEVAVGPDADGQARLLGAMGRQP
jgi:uncharacterized protein (TIGR03086 family)